MLLSGRFIVEQRNAIVEGARSEQIEMHGRNIGKQRFSGAQHDRHDDQTVVVDESEIGELPDNAAAAQDGELFGLFQFPYFSGVDLVKEPDIFPVGFFRDVFKRFGKNDLGTVVDRTGHLRIHIERGLGGPEALHHLVGGTAEYQGRIGAGLAVGILLPFRVGFDRLEPVDLAFRPGKKAVDRYVIEYGYFAHSGEGLKSEGYTTNRLLGGSWLHGRKDKSSPDKGIAEDQVAVAFRHCEEGQNVMEGTI